MSKAMVDHMQGQAPVALKRWLASSSRSSSHTATIDNMMTDGLRIDKNAWLGEGQICLKAEKKDNECSLHDLI